MEKNEDRYTHFEVIGAGDIQLSNNCSCKCGGKLGFHIGVSWTKLKYCGGLLSREDAKLLADHIYKVLGKPKRTTPKKH